MHDTPQSLKGKNRETMSATATKVDRRESRGRQKLGTSVTENVHW